MTQEERRKRLIEMIVKKLDSRYVTIQHLEKDGYVCVRPCDIFSELQESEDERIRKMIINTLNRDKILTEDEAYDCVAWLEKLKDYVPPQMVADAYLRGCNDTEKKWLEKQGEQKTDIKVVPNFKIGDWVTNGYCKCQITFIDSRYWYSETCVLGDVESIDKKFHLWTIADAKDGDVLATENFIFIFKNIDNGNGIHYYCHYEINKHEDDNQFGIALSQSLMGRVGNSTSHYFPATKEQRDLLFQKMKENNWKWDAEKKELKKIENSLILSNSSKTGKNETKWTEEDEKHLRLSTDIIDSALSVGFCVQLDRDICVDWFKSLKQRMEQ